MQGWIDCKVKLQQTSLPRHLAGLKELYEVPNDDGEDDDDERAHDEVVERRLRTGFLRRFEERARATREPSCRRGGLQSPPQGHDDAALDKDETKTNRSWKAPDSGDDDGDLKAKPASSHHPSSASRADPEAPQESV